MGDTSNSSINARFWGQDPRFVVIGDDHYPALLTEYLENGAYCEDLTEFHGYREQFFALAERRAKAVLVRNGQDFEGEDDPEWEMIGLYELANVALKGNKLRCVVGRLIDKVEEEDV